MAATDTIDFKAVFDVVPTPLALIATDLVIVDINQRFLDAMGRTREGLIGRNIFDAFPAPDITARILKGSLQRAFHRGEADHLPVLRYPIPVRGEAAIEERFWSVSHWPIRDRGDRVAYVLQNAQDITAVQRQRPEHQPSKAGDKRDLLDTAAIGQDVLERAERVQAINKTLLRETAQLRNLFMRAPSFMCVLRGSDFRFELANKAFVSLVGPRELVGRTFREAIPEADGQAFFARLDEVYRSGEAFVGREMKAEFQRLPGHEPIELFLNFVYQPIFGDDGRVVGIFVDGNDITDHVRAEKSQALLVRELHHRVRNTLATVQGVMNSTARTAETIEDYQWAFSGRISSLARTHSLLTEEIQQFVSFLNLLRQEVGAYAEGAKDRVVLEGPDVELPSQLAVPLGMTIHELSTNAFRHGALSVPRGRVTVTWTIVPAKEKRILSCHWIESNGPPVTPPSRHGFGSMILTRVLSQQIGAKVEAKYSPEGFELAAEIPLDIERG